MSLLSRTELKMLSEERDAVCVSIFMPTQKSGAATQQNPIRLKNLLADAEKRLVEGGLRPPAAQTLLEPAQRLLQDTLFWQHQSDGLALFLSSDVFRIYRLPVNFSERLISADRFHIKPLLPLLSEDARFYVLVLDQEGVDLYQGTPYSMSKVELRDTPQDVAAVLSEDFEAHVQFHSGTRTPGGKGGERPAVFHGHGGGEGHDIKEDIARYFQRVDTGIQTLLGHEQIPLVLAGDEYLLPIYEKINSYPNLVDEGITINPEALNIADLREKAWGILEPRFKADREEAVTIYKQLAGNDSEFASTDLRKIVPAAYYSRVETAFVATDTQQWGTFDPDASTVQLQETPKLEAEDLVDFVAVHTLMNGGTVYAGSLDSIPDDAPVAAVLRY